VHKTYDQTTNQRGDRGVGGSSKQANTGYNCGGSLVQPAPESLFLPTPFHLPFPPAIPLAWLLSGCIHFWLDACQSEKCCVPCAFKVHLCQSRSLCAHHCIKLYT